MLIDADGGRPDVILIATGSEVQLAVQARATLAAEGIKARVVSAPSLEWFAEQDAAYRESVLPASVTARVSVEAGSTPLWKTVVGDRGRSVGIDHFGASADYKTLFEKFGVTADADRGSGSRNCQGERMSTPTQDLADAGVSIWLDDLSRQRITTGNLQEASSRPATSSASPPTRRSSRAPSRQASAMKRPSRRRRAPAPRPMTRSSR